MQNDLISRNDLIYKIRAIVPGSQDVDFIVKLIGEQPTAYDVDNVVEQLEAELELANKQKRECICKALPYYDRTKGYVEAIENAIDIVRNGGKE